MLLFVGLKRTSRFPWLWLFLRLLVLGWLRFPADYGRLPGFHPGQGPTQRSAAQNVDIPVPGGKRAIGGPQGSVPGQSSSPFRAAARRGVHQGFLPEQSSAAISGGQQGSAPGQTSTPQVGAHVRGVRLQSLSPDRVQQRLVEQTFALGVSARAYSRPSGVDEVCQW